MTGLEAIILVPFVYGCVHLGKKVLDQSRVIDNQNALIDVQRETITVLQSTPNPSGGSATAARAAVALSGVAIATSLLVYNTHRWYSQTHARSSGAAPQHHHHHYPSPGDSYAPTPATGEQDECKICCENQRDTILLPCRHFALCWVCASKIMDSEDNNCPICRTEILSAQFTFVS
jgi:hypothetical protein